MKKITQILSVALISGLLFSGCTKTTTDDAAKFAGTWTGTSCGGASSFTLVESNNTTLTSTGTIGTGVASCTKTITYNHTASGNTLTIPSQTFTDNCGNSYTFSGSGSLSGTTLTLTETVSGAVNATCTFVGTK